jgi:hypothetical protein
MATNPQLSPQQLQQLVDLYKKIDGLTDSAASNAAQFAINNGNALNELVRLEKEFKLLLNNIEGTREAFARIVDDVKGFNSGINRAKNAFKGLESLASKLQNHQSDVNRLSTKELETLRKKSKEKLADLELAKKLADEETRRLYRIRKRSDEDKDAYDKALSVSKELGDQIQENNSTLQGFNEQLEDQIRLSKQADKNLGITGNLLKGISKIPVLGNLINAEEALAAAQSEAAKEGSSRTKVLGASFKSLGKSLKENLTDPLVVGGILLKGFKMFLELGFAADKQITELGKSMAVTKDEAALTRERFVEIQKSTDSIADGQLQNLIITKNLVEAQGQLANAFGATRGFTDAQLQDQIMLTKQVGLEEESAAGLQQLALANGKSANDILKSTIKQTAALARQTGVQLDNRKILNEVAKVSGQLRLQYQNNPDLIAKAVVQTQKLGISLEQAKNIAGKLLDFESSITNELEAELLTGKNLNLENARLLALQGDSAGALAEIARQTGSAAEFSKMNVIAQQSFAEAVGMSADELANSLVYQENLTKLGNETRKQVEEQIELAKQQGDLDKVRMLERSIGDEKNAEKALKEIDAQEKFNNAIEKLKSLLTSIVEGPAAKFVDGLSNIENIVTRIKVAAIAIGSAFAAIKLAGILTQLATMAATTGAAAAGALTWAAGITLGVGLAGIGIALAAAMGAFDSDKEKAAEVPKSKISDGVINPNGGLVVSGPEGSIQLNKKDSVIAGTNLGGGEGASSELAEIKNILSQILAKDTSIYMDSTKVSTGFNISTVRIQ